MPSEHLNLRAKVCRWTGINSLSHPTALPLDKWWQSTKYPRENASKSLAAAFWSCEKRLQGSCFVSLLSGDVYYALVH